MAAVAARCKSGGVDEALSRIDIVLEQRDAAVPQSQAQTKKMPEPSQK